VHKPPPEYFSLIQGNVRSEEFFQQSRKKSKKSEK
jgi:hypothetical protein